ncbi:MAG: PAP2 family protein [Candidatus Aenigmarchaeota archaeon]|nr:PAP2 family protein [Candidatus Aenigmarchaeota archaeon]
MDKEKLQLISNFTSAPIFGSIIFLIFIFSKMGTLPITQIALISVISLLFMTVIPVTYVVLFVKKRKKFQDIDYDISDRSLRIKPFLAVITSYAIGIVALFSINAPVLVKGLMFCYFLNGLIMFLITLFWKISIHTSGITGPLTLLIYEFGIIYSPLLLIAIPVGWMRIKLKKHLPSQVIAGAVLTIILTWLQIVYIIVPFF